MKNLDEITINDILENIIKTYAIKKKRKDIISYYVQKFEVGLFGNENEEGKFITENEIAKRVEDVLKADKNSAESVFYIYQQ